MIRSMVYGFFMCWGMFLAIPCPCKIWDETARNKMLLWFPVLGLIPGGIWAALYWVLSKVSCPRPMMALVMGIIPWIVTGFLHLDGYMDVCDGILSRRDLETRQKILKDSHCGSFAVICMILLAMAVMSVGMSVDSYSVGGLLAVPVAVRAMAAMAVTYLPAMGSSQYAKMKKSKAVQGIWYGMLLIAANVLPLLFGKFSFAPLASMIGYGIACAYGYKNLGGMSGDISGFALVIGEFLGYAVAGLAG